jgi:transposase-like protein
MDERLQFVARRLAGEPMAELCREFGISRKTQYKKGRPFWSKVWVLTSNHPERSTPFYD